MFEWITSIENYFTELGDSVNTLIYDMQTLINNLNAYITLSTYYIYGSGFMIIVLFFMLINNAGKLNKSNIKLEQQEKDLEYIIELLEKQIKKPILAQGVQNGSDDERDIESNNSSS